MKISENNDGFFCKLPFGGYVRVETVEEGGAEVAGYTMNKGLESIYFESENIRGAVSLAMRYFKTPEIVEALKAIKAEMDEIDAEREPPRDFPLLAA